MADSTTYEGPEYQPPKIILSIGPMLRMPRRTYTTSFADVLSPDQELQYSYVDGLLVVGAVFLVLAIVWGLILIVLKLKGKEVGCASGEAFHTTRVEEDDMDLRSTDSSGSYSTSIGERSDSERKDEFGREVDDDQSNMSSDSFEDLFDEAEDYDSRDGWISADGALPKKKTNKREQRTRFFFIFFSLVALICVPLILVFSFGPMKEAARTSDDVMLVAHDALAQISASLNAIDSATGAAVNVVEATPTDLKELCPNIDKDDIKAALGIDINDLADTISEGFEELNDVVDYQLGLVKKVVQLIEDGLVTFEDSVEQVESYMWIVPGVLLSASLVAALAILGVMLAWKDKAGKRVQKVMSYFVLPSLIVISIACWIIVIMTSFGTMVSSDMCTTSVSHGSPDETIQVILSNHGLSQNDTVFKLANAYTNRCIGSDPTEDVNELEKIVQENIDSIWRQLSKVDSIGRAQLVEQCGSEELKDLFAGARNLAKLLTAIRRALDSASSSLQCSRINSIYTQAVHSAVCTDAAAAAAYGFIMFLVLALSTMTMISLRASWMRNIEEEKVYHDESEVAENMIVDEHEEYLAYISKYKHEWQEYHGFEERSIGQSESSHGDEGSRGSGYFERQGREGSRTDGEGYNGSAECSEMGSDVSPRGLDVDIFPASMQAPSIDDGAQSCDIDEISFPSLDGRPSEESASIREEDLFKFPPPLLPPAANPDYREEANDVPVASESKTAQPESPQLEHPRRESPRNFVPGQSVRPPRASSHSRSADLAFTHSRSSDLASIYSRSTDPEGSLRSFFNRFGIDPKAHELEIRDCSNHSPDNSDHISNQEKRLDPPVAKPAKALRR